MSSVEERLNRAVPGGLNDSQLHTRMRRGMLELPEDVAHHLLDDFERTVAIGKTEIRNPAAYISTVVQRTLANLEDTRLNPRVVTPALRDRMDLLYSRFCHPDDIDRRCKEILLEIDEHEAIRALDELEGTDRSEIKSVSAFLMGILQKYIKRGNTSGTPKGSARGILKPPGSSHFNTEWGSLDDSPAPRVMPMDLLFRYGCEDVEYIPEMPRKPRLFPGMNLPAGVEAKLEQLINARLLTMEDLSERTLNEFQRLTESQGLAVLKEFSLADLANVRSRGGYIVGIARKLFKLPQDEHHVYDAAPRDEYAPPFKRSRFEDPATISRDPRIGHIPTGTNYPPPPAAGMPPYYPGREVSPRGGAVLRPPRPIYSEPIEALRRDHFEPTLRQAIDAEIERGVRAGLITHEDIDESTRDYLSAQNFGVAIRSISEFLAKDMRKIRNKGSFLKGIVQKLLQRELSSYT